jgi:Domain of Unknown Function (DUF748)
VSEVSGKYPAFVKGVAVLAIILLLLPEVIRFAAIKAVSSSGVGEASIDDVDFNIFTGELVVRQFDLTRGGANTLSVSALAINLGWLRLLSGEIGIENLTVDGAKFTALQTEQGGWDVVIPFTSEAPADGAQAQEQSTGDEATAGLPKLGLKQLLLRDAQITVKSPMANGKLTIDKLTLQRVSTWRETSPALALVAKWNGAPIVLNVRGEPLAPEPNLQGQLKVRQFALASVAGATGQDLAGAVDLALDFNGKRNSNQIFQSELEGTLTLQGFEFHYGPLELRHRELLLQSKATASLEGDQLIYQVASDLQSQGLSVADKEQGVSLLNWETLSLSNFLLDSQFNASFDQLNLQAIDAIHDISAAQNSSERGRMYTGAVTVTDLTLSSEKRLSIDEVVVENTHYQIVVLKDGRLQLESVLSSVVSNLNRHVEKDTQEPGVETKDDSDAMTIAVNAFTVGGDSYIEWQDLRFEVPVKEKIKIEEFSIRGIDQSRPDQPATVNFVSRIGEFSRAKISGTVKPFAEKASANIAGKLEAIALPNLSPYTEAYLGYHLTTGQYDHEFDIKIIDENIKLKNKLDLRQLTLSAVDPDKPQPMEQQLDVPLAFALDMLRDGDDNISLDVPVEGKLDDPNINIGDVVNDALGNALKNGATSYLKYAIQPYGAVLIAAELVGDQVSAISLDPIVHRQGQSQLTAEHIAYIGKVATLMNERPKLSIKLCGQSNEQDKVVIAETLINSAGEIPNIEKAMATVTQEQLVELAKSRMNEVKRLFIDNGIDSKRVFSCQPQFKPEATNGVVMAI